MTSVQVSAVSRLPYLIRRDESEHGKIEMRGVFPVFPGPCPSLREGNNGYAGLNRDVQKRRKLFSGLTFPAFRCNVFSILY